MDLSSGCSTLSSYFRVISKIIRKFPGGVNMAKEDGYSALHIAVVNGLEDIVCLLLKSVSFRLHFDRSL